MIFEYALDPELVPSWTEPAVYRYFYESFGLGSPRLVSRLPSNWKRRVFEWVEASESLGDIEKKRVEELVIKFSEAMVRRSVDPVNYSDWLAGAMEEHRRHPFRAILSERGRGEPFVLSTNSILENDCPDWRVDFSTTIKRNAKDMANVVSPLLSVSKEIHFVDPHFGPENKRYVNSFREFFTAINKLDVSRRCNVTIHCLAKTKIDFFKNKFIENFGKSLSSGFDVKLFRWHDKNKVHNRYIITELGSLQFAHGLDEGKPEQKDIVSILNRKCHEELRHDYVDMIDSQDVEGPISLWKC